MFESEVYRPNAFTGCIVIASVRYTNREFLVRLGKRIEHLSGALTRIGGGKHGMNQVDLQYWIYKSPSCPPPWQTRLSMRIKIGAEQADCLQVPGGDLAHVAPRGSIDRSYANSVWRRLVSSPLMSSDPTQNSFPEPSRKRTSHR